MRVGHASEHGVQDRLRDLIFPGLPYDLDVHLTTEDIAIGPLDYRGSTPISALLTYVLIPFFHVALMDVFRVLLTTSLPRCIALSLFLDDQLAQRKDCLYQ